MKVGVMPPVGNGLVHYQRTGQLGRLFAHLEAYRGHSWYFSYQPYWEERDLWRDDLGDLIGPMKSLRNPLRYALLRPMIESRTFRECTVLRCTSLLGSVPALVANVVHGLPFLFTYGADYLKIAQIHGRSRLHLRKWRLLQALAMRRAAAVIVQNKMMAERLRAAYPAATIRHLPNWVDTDRFMPGPPGAKPDDLRTVLYVGRLVAEKNLEVLAQACKEVNARLLCVGEGPLEDTLRDMKHVTLAGPIPWDMLPNFQRVATVFAMVSHTEGHSKSLTEAMAGGMPCIVSKAVTEGMVSGTNCLQVDPDLTSVALGLEVLFADRDLASRLGREARQTTLERWSKAKILRRELDLLHEVSGR